jgi:hypothetical protein
MKLLLEKLNSVLCYIESRGKHFELYTTAGDQHCIQCGTYLYTNYDQNAALKARRSLYKMWWESLES